MAKTKRTILVVDDTFMVRQTLKMVLEAEGYEVREAEHARSAMNLLKQDADVDLIMLDIQMPEVDGLGLCRVIKAYEATKDIPVIMCTGEGDEQAILDARKFGAVDFILKPLEAPVILDRVNRILGGASIQPEPPPAPKKKKKNKKKKKSTEK